jgi:hypothetical protein
MRKPSYLLLFVLVLILLIFIVGAVFIVQRSPKSGEAQFTGQAVLNYAETFATDTFKDATQTTAQWDTTQGAVTLTQSDGDFYMADRTTLGADLIDSGGFANFREATTIALDSNGFPNVVWNNNPDTKEIFFSRWDGSQWVKMDGTPGFDNLSNSLAPSSHSPSIALDANDRPHVAWMEDQVGVPELFDIYHLRWNGTAWVGMAGAGPDNVSSSATGPNISNVDPQIKVDSLGTPHIAWASNVLGGSWEVFYASWTGTAWDGLLGSGPDNVSNQAIGASPILNFELDGLGRPVFSWFGFTDVFFSRWNGSAYVMADGVTPGADGIGAATSTPTVPSDPTLALDSNGQPYVAFTFSTAPGGRGSSRIDIYMTRWDTTLGAWSKVNRTTPTAGFDNITNLSAGQNATRPSLQIDGQDNPAIAFAGGTLGGVAFTRYNGSIWVQVDRVTPGLAVIMASGDSFDLTPSLVLDILGNPALALDGTHAELSPVTSSVYFTQWIQPCVSPAIAQSLAVDTSADPVLSATLVADAQAFDGSITYALSNDGGTSFETVTPGVPHVFTSTGSDLRWRATLTVGSHPGVCPFIDALSIDYLTQDPLPAVPSEPGDTTQIFRVQGDDPVELAINTSQARFTTPGSAAAVVLARSNLISDALAITPYANLKNASLLLTPSDSVPAIVISEISRVLGAGNSSKIIYLAGGDQALSEQVEIDLANAGFTSHFRFPGADRRETARLIANQIMLENPAPITQAFISEEQAFVDTLGLGSIAGQKIGGSVRPILLTERGVPTPGDSLLTFLTEHPTITSLEIAGGEAAVPLEVGPLIQQQQPQITTLERSAGVDRFATNAAFNAKYYPTFTTVVLANGEASALPGAQVSATASSSGLFSALLAGNFAAGQSAPLVITTRDLLPAPIASYLEAHASTIDTVYIIGSLSLISQAVEDAVRAIVD